MKTKDTGLRIAQRIEDSLSSRNWWNLACPTLVGAGRALSLAALLTTQISGEAIAGGGSSQNSTLPTLGAEVEAVQVAAGDMYGSSVSICGSRAAIGAPGDDEAEVDAGAVYLFRSEAGQWRFEAKLMAPTAAAGDGFGSSLSLDDDFLIVGAPGGDNGAPNAGFACIYEREGNTWQWRQSLENTEPSAAAHFGQAVVLSGVRAFVGVPDEAAGGLILAFDRSGDVWSRVASLRGSDTSPGNSFGTSLDFDGTTLVVGAHGATPGGSWSGAAYVFAERNGQLGEIQQLVPFDTTASLFFGIDVAVDGELIAIGARGDASGELWSGAAYTYKANDGNWALERKLKSEDVVAGANFGSSVALSGETLVVGARWDSAAAINGGAAYLFRRSEGGWPEEAQLVRLGAGYNDWFGAALDLDRGEMLVGAPRSDSPEPDSGSVSGWRVAPGSSLCAGDGTSFPCSCANLGGAGRGCANSQGGGAVLQVDGTASLSANDLRWFASELAPMQPALLLSSTEANAAGYGYPFGDGLQCLAGTQTRLAASQSNVEGALQWNLADLRKGSFAVGQTRYFQVWYRDPAASPCNSGYNTTNAYVVTFGS